MRTTTDYSGYNVTVKVTPESGSSFTIPAKDIYSCSAICGVGSSKNFFGFSICQNGELTILNNESQYSSKSFENAKVEITCNHPTSGNFKRNTMYAFSPKKTAGRISMVLMDSIAISDVDYISTIDFPCTLKQLYEDVCKTVSSSYDSSGMINGNAIIKKKPKYKCRKILEYIAMCEGGNVIADYSGKIKIVRYSTSATATNITSIFASNPEVAESPVSMTGVTATIYVSEKEDEEGSYKTVEKTYSAGSVINELNIKNPLLTEENAQSIVNNVYNNIKNISITPMVGNIFDRPAFEFGDRITFTDTYVGTVTTYITDMAWDYNNYTVLGSDNENETSNDGDYIEDQIEDLQDQIDADEETNENNNGELQDQIDEITSNTETFQKEYEKFKTDIQDKLAQTSGFYQSEQTNADGAKIVYWHDKPELSKSKKIWKITSNAIAISTDGGITYPYGFTVDGDMVMSNISVEKLNAMNLVATSLKSDTIVSNTVRVGSGTKVSEINNNGSFQLGGTNGIKYNPTTNQVTLGSNVVISWDNISGTDGVLTDDDLEDYVKEEDLNSSAYARPNLIDPDLARWTMSNSYGKIEYVVDEDEDGNITDEYYEMTRTDTSSSYTYLYYDFDAEPNTTYTLSMYVHSLGAGVSLVTSNNAINSVARGVVVSEVGRYVRAPLKTTSSTAYGRICISFNSSNVARISKVKLEKGDTATDYIEEPVTRGRVTKISQYEISTSKISCDQLEGGEIRGQEFVSLRKTTNDDTTLRLRDGAIWDYGKTTYTTGSGYKVTRYRSFREYAGEIRFCDDANQNNIDPTSDGFDHAEYIVEINGRGAYFLKREEDDLWNMSVTIQPNSFDVQIPSNFLGTITCNNINPTKINNVAIGQYALKSDIPDITPTEVTSFTASTGFANVTGSVKAFESLGFAVVDLKVEVTATIARGTAKQVLTIPTSVRPSSYKALTCVGYNTTAHRKLLINCYCNSSGAVYVMIPSNTDGSSNINGSDFTLSSSYSNMLSITGTYLI